MTPASTQQTADQRAAEGKQERSRVPRSSHADWAARADRADPVEILTAQDDSRLPWLVPVRHARMAESPFAFFRGAASVMAGDLADTPTIDVPVQLCGDAHLSNFGTFASAERRQVFDVNDFDETMPGPWEWDIKRLAASMVVAARDNGLSDKHGRAAARDSVQAYAGAMSRFASSPALEVWYAQVSLEDLRRGLPSKDARKTFDKNAAKARSRDSQRALGKLAETVDGQLRIRSQPPLLVPLRDLAEHLDTDQLSDAVRANFAGYVDSLPADRRHLLHRFTVVDIALKVVGVGSVGTRCWIVLLTGRDHGEPMFLQVKEANESALQPYLPATEHDHPGRRVVEGQRLMQASGDVFLGWSDAMGGAHYYWRQFHDMKGSADVAAMHAEHLAAYGQLCGWTLAHAHARSGDAATIGGYLGSGTSFSRALAEFAVAYADQNEADYATFTTAVAEGRVDVEP
jgi:uncharacterized protein (DUF2252 family)